MPRTDGRKIVALAFGATTLAIGIGQIYLPYIADRDKIRGLFEEDDMPVQAKREMEIAKKQHQQQQQLQQQKMQQQEVNQQQQQQQQEGKKSAGSMWSNLRRN